MWRSFLFSLSLSLSLSLSVCLSLSSHLSSPHLSSMLRMDSCLVEVIVKRIYHGQPPVVMSFTPSLSYFSSSHDLSILLTQACLYAFISLIVTTNFLLLISLSDFSNFLFIHFFFVDLVCLC